MPQGKKRQPQIKNGWQERLRNQVNRKSGTCEFRRSSRMEICQRGFWDIWNTDNKTWWYRNKKKSVIMAFTWVEKPHLFIAGLPALPHPCVKRSFFFHRNVPLTYPRGEWIQTRFGFLFPSHIAKTDYPWLFLPVCRSCLLLMVSFIVSINGLILSHFL